VVEHRDAVTILPVAGDGRLILVRQYRLPAGQVLLEAPAGNIDDGEAPEQTAHREIREETGYGCRRLEPLLAFYPAPGFSDEFMHCFVASDLFEAPLDPDEDEALQVEEVTLETALEMVRRGEIKDGKTICSLLAYARWWPA
jgi:ADP-ribose pyrophosphatase